jgi:mono/diheme cytochrome c family protein
LYEMRQTMKQRLTSGAALLLCLSGLNLPASAQTAADYRALLNQYCVTCHNDKTKTDNFSLEKADLNAVGSHPEVWERVIRKLRAGMMPPPGCRARLWRIRRAEGLAGDAGGPESGGASEPGLGGASSAEFHGIR